MRNFRTGFVGSGESAWLQERLHGVSRVAYLEERLLDLRIGFVAQRGFCNQNA